MIKISEHYGLWIIGRLTIVYITPRSLIMIRNITSKLPSFDYLSLIINVY